SLLKQALKSQAVSTNGVEYTSSDPSFVALRDILESQPDSSLLCMPDELIEVFRNLSSRGQSASKKGHWLSSWSGTELIIHRHKKKYSIPRAAVSIFGGIQPDTFRDEVAR